MNSVRPCRRRGHRDERVERLPGDPGRWRAECDPRNPPHTVRVAATRGRGGTAEPPGRARPTRAADCPGGEVFRARRIQVRTVTSQEPPMKKRLRYLSEAEPELEISRVDIYAWPRQQDGPGGQWNGYVRPQHQEDHGHVGPGTGLGSGGGMPALMAR